MELSLAAWTNDLMAPPFAGYIFVGHCGAGHASWILLPGVPRSPSYSAEIRAPAIVTFQESSRIYSHHDGSELRI